jgi:hypothetical protein
VDLRRRSRNQLRRYARTALIVVGASAAIGVAAAGGYALYRYSRPPTRRERLVRLVPSSARARWHDLVRLRQGWRADVKQRAGEVGRNLRQPQSKPEPAKLESIAVRAAKALGTASGTALATTLARRMIAKSKQG